MKKVFLQYNPFTIETIIKIDGEPISKDGTLYSYKDKRLQEWLDRLFPELVEECNDEIELTYKGTQLDYEDICSAKEEYLRSKASNKVPVELKPLPFARNAEERLDELIDLFDGMQRECPFPDLQTEELRRAFRRAVETEFEVSVIATMSSGKSTLINALLGRELMPSKNAACTATISHIKDVDGMEGFSAICMDENGEIIEKSENLTLEAMSRYNEDSKIVDINIKGDIPFVSSQNMQLILLDTPGPNNSRTEEHRKRTLRVIKSDDMPMVIYVMNATQLFTDDDETLFGNVAESMNSHHGKQARDRFLFVINKADMLDPEKGESVDNIIQEARKYLSDNGIEDANIYPVSAEMAKLIRMNKNGAELTRKQRRDLEDSVELFSVEGMQLDEYAPLSAGGRNALMKDIELAKINASAYDETLVHTGVPAVEIAIAEYLEKYALTSKIYKAVDTFKNLIKEKHLMTALEEEMSKNEERRREVNAEMNALSAQLADGKEAQKFRVRLEKMSLGNLTNTVSREIGPKYVEKLRRFQGNKEMSFEEADHLIDSIKKQIPAIERDLITDLEKMIDKSIVKSSKLIIDEYKQHIKSLLKDTNFQGHDFNTAFNIFTAHISSNSAMLNKFSETRTRKVKVGEREVSDFCWYKPWKWFAKRKEDIFEDQNYKVTDGKRITEEILRDMQKSLNDNIESAVGKAQEESERFKKYFIEELDKLDSVVIDKTKKLASVSSDEKALKKAMEKNRYNQEWLSNFQEKLDAVIKM